MLTFGLLAATLVVIAYYLFRDTEPDETKTTAAPAKEDRRAPRTKSRKNREADIHAKKVQKKAEDAFNAAMKRTENVASEEDRKEMMRASYVLAESLKKMFSSTQFFEQRTQFDSFRTAIKAAEDARDQLVDQQEQEMRQADAVVPTSSGHVGNRYVRHTVESALMISWCAGGLIGKSRHASAQEAFHVSVSAEDVQSWERFGQVLRKESEHYMTA